MIASPPSDVHQLQRKPGGSIVPRIQYEVKRGQTGPSYTPQADPSLPPIGALVFSDDGETIQCHVCGEWYANVGAHLRKHKITPKQYREKFGLRRGTALAAPALRYDFAEKGW
jgi:predicted transcriptional regulator